MYSEPYRGIRYTGLLTATSGSRRICLHPPDTTSYTYSIIVYVLLLVNTDNTVTRRSQRQRFDVDCKCYSVIHRLLTGIALLWIHKVYSRRTQCVSTQRTHCRHDVHVVCTRTSGVCPYTRCTSLYIRTICVHSYICTHPSTMCTPDTLIRLRCIRILGVHPYTLCTPAIHPSVYQSYTWRASGVYHAYSRGYPSFTPAS